MGAGLSARALMCNYSHSSRMILIGGFLLSTLVPIAAKGDHIVFLIDEQGRKIYVNSAERPGGVNWMGDSRTGGLGFARSVPSEISKLVDETARRFHVDPELVHAVIRVESGYDPHAISSKGAKGLMQLIPSTAAQLGVADVFDPRQNIEGGVKHLKYLLDLFHGNLNLSLAAYNAGEHSVQRSGGIPAIAETQNYVRKINALYKKGDTPGAAATLVSEPPTVAITRYVDQNGVVHFTNVE